MKTETIAQARLSRSRVMRISVRELLIAMLPYWFAHLYIKQLTDTPPTNVQREWKTITFGTRFTELDSVDTISMYRYTRCATIEMHAHVEHVSEIDGTG